MVTHCSGGRALPVLTATLNPRGRARDPEHCAWEVVGQDSVRSKKFFFEVYAEPPFLTL